MPVPPSALNSEEHRPENEREAGGITEWRKIASFADVMNVNMGHHEEPEVALHLLAAIPNATFVEIFPDKDRDPMWYELVAERPRISEGYMYLPQCPAWD